MPLINSPYLSRGFRGGLSGALLFSLVAGCGSSDENGGSLTLTGTARDYFSDTPIATADLILNELGLTTTAAADGSFEFTGIPRRSILTVTVEAANYRPTTNDTIQFVTTDLVHPVQAVALADVTRQYTLLSLTPTAGTAVIIATLVDGGSPLQGVPLANIALHNTAMTPVGNGPYFVGAAGDVDQALTVSTAFGGRSRVVFLDVPVGLNVLELTIPDGPPRIRTANIVTVSNGVSFATP